MDDPVSVRAAALLGRQALEGAVSSRLASVAPGSEGVTSFRAKLLCLQVSEREVGTRASHLWGELTRACHHHPYELSPTAGEVLELLREAAELCRLLGATPAPDTSQATADAGGDHV